MRNGMTHDQGAKVIIHDPSKPPNIVSEGIPVRPGTSSNIGLQLEVLHRLEAPYQSNCSSEWVDGFGNNASLYQGCVFFVQDDILSYFCFFLNFMSHDHFTNFS